MAELSKDSASPNRSAFHRLPAELRLEIYSYIVDDPLTLLCLSHVCHKTYTDINNNNKLIHQNIYGYCYNNPDRYYSYYIFADRDKPHPILSTGATPLIIPVLYHLEINLDDVITFNRSFGLKTPEEKGWWCCRLCAKVRHTSDYQIPPLKMDTTKNEPSLAQALSPFLALPYELRLEIYYAICDPISLLILTHTCRTMYVDINSRKHLVRSVLPSDFTDEHELVKKHGQKTSLTSHPILTPYTTPLTIYLIAIADTKLETTSVSLFNRIYGLTDQQKMELTHEQECDTVKYKRCFASEVQVAW
ncbi:hypothetical protein BJ508DRAFT_333557 [Ascobolus immersus RN42]|uniref:F-box domain-containing protein n=1 Tax=Ascobolus immersus RN42 TaxID=1160509 RepID=A0A3N4HNB0_ASCIM|nr:hypothetical protein BJ508DRAFT_333557 [Ascobolus immersus RN42]